MARALGRDVSCTHDNVRMGIVNKIDAAGPPPFPFTVEKFVTELTSDQATKAAQACAALANLAAKAPLVPQEFRTAVPAVVSLLTRQENGFDATAVRESATAALSALLACVDGASEVAVAEGMVGKLLSVTRGENGGEGGSGGGAGAVSLTLNAMECIRILATDDAGAASLIVDDGAMSFVISRCGVDTADPASESALDVLCSLASKGRGREAVIRAGGVTAIAKALVSSSRIKRDETIVRALLGLAMTTSGEAQQAELVGVPGAVPAVMAATRSTRDKAVAGISKDLWGVLGRNQELKPALAAALRAHMEEQQRLGAADGMDAA